MTITSVTLAWAGSTGVSNNDGREYTATYRVETDSYLDQTKTIIDFFKGNTSFDGLALPYLDSSYQFGNDSDIVALCDSITPKRAAESQQHWTVEFHYKTPQQEEDETGETEAGGSSNNPLQWRTTCEISFVEYSRPVSTATYRGGMTNGLIEPGDEYAVVNSAMTVLDPPLERAAMKVLFRFGKYRHRYPNSAKNAFRAVNDKPFKIRVRDPDLLDEDGDPAHTDRALDLSFEPFQCQISSVNAALVQKNNATVWQLSAEMLADYEFGYRVDVLDRGLSAKAGDGDPDGMGGFFSPSDAVTGRPKERRLLDAKGVPITEPVLFDGNGQPLALGADPVYITWSVYPETDFADFKDFLPIHGG